MPTHFHLLPVILFSFFSCADNTKEVEITPIKKVTGIAPKHIRGIPLPQGFSYVDDADTSYAKWLLDLELKKAIQFTYTMAI